MKRYNPIEIEQKWQDEWEKSGIYHVDLSDTTKPKYLGFSMLPGITGAGIHIGHGRTFQFSDIKVRAKRQQGFNAYNPIGWDSFGLPVENYAIKVGKKPREAHDEAKANFIRQLKRLGYSYDWSKEISTADPQYYKWTQWIFNQLLKHGLAYQKEQDQWWCETDNTVLANEQVEGGKCWRCGNPVTKKKLKQWFFRITAYADEILDATDDLNWTEMVKTMQKNWIGRSIGAEVDFEVVADESRVKSQESLSYVMGNKHISEEDLEKIGARVDKVTSEGHLCVSFSATSAEKFEELIREKMQPGFWNEYLNNDTVIFIFKELDGNTKRFVWPRDREEDIISLCNRFANANFTSVQEMLAGNSWYSFRASQLVPHTSIRVFTTRPDTLFGATFMVLAPEHELVQKITTEEQRQAVDEYVKQATAKSDLERQEGSKEKTGVFTGAYAINPVTGGQIPVWIADYVLTGYGTGAVMAVPAHDERDGEFASKFNLPITRVIQPSEGNSDEFYTGEGTLTNSGQFDGMSSAEAREEVVAWLEQQGIGRAKVQFKMRDWLISRQRYWGAPIPVVYCQKDGVVPVPDDQLPVVLPDIDDFKPKGGATSALAQAEDWVNTVCPTCSGPAKRETDTMDGYACSSWYFLRYIDPFNDKQAWSPEAAEHWQPVDYYNGADHAVAHLLYSRFWMRFFHKLGLVPSPEPFKRMMYNAYIMAPDGQKMSKSKGNVIDPMEIMDSGYGADSLRVYEMFIAPYDQDAPWDTRGVPGTYRFLNRLWVLVQEFVESPSENDTSVVDTDLLRLAHKTIKKVSSDIDGDKFNTAVASMMEAVNGLYKLKEKSPLSQSEAWRFALESLLQILAPFAPHISEELWHDMGHTDTIHVDHWPEWDESLLVSKTVKIVVQVNGKVRANIEVPTDATKEDLEAVALANDHVKEYVGNKKPTRVVVVPGRLVNVVV